MALNFALLGAGRIGQTHARAVGSNPDANLHSVFDPMPAAAQSIADGYGAKIRTLDDIENDPEIDAVLICTPTNTHCDLIETFVKAGKAVFCEKPVDLDVARVRGCLKTVEEHNGKLMLGFNRRFDNHFLALKSAIDRGDIGTVEQVVLTSRDPGLPPVEYVKVSGGIFRDMTIHDFDMARFLLGEEIATVSAVGSNLVDPALTGIDYDTASVILTTASGKQAMISNSRRASYGYDQRIEVHGSLGCVSAKNQRPNDIEIATETGFNRSPLHDFFMTRYLDAYAAEITAFVDTIKQGENPSPNAMDGLRSLEIADAATKSANEGVVVRL